jgi:hypothetical protein
MANTLTNLIPTLYNALDVVSREMVGFIPACSRDATADRAALNQTVRSFETRPAGAEDVTPGVTAPNDGDAVVDNVPITITKSRRVPVRIRGEEELSLSSPGIGWNNILQDRFAQAMRTLVKEIEIDLGTAAYKGASTSVGVLGTNPFVVSSDFAIDRVSDLRKALADHGSPMDELQLVIDTAAGAALRKIPNLYRVNEAGDTDFLRRGVLSDLLGFGIRESVFGVQRPVVGTTTATINNAGYAIGATSLVLTDAAVDLKKGDVITIANDTTGTYVVAEDVDTNAGTLRIAKPGLRQATGSSARAITVIASGPRNVGFARSALYLAARAPARPSQGDMADDVTIVQDPVSGLPFEVSVYRQYRQVHYEVAIAWGVANLKAEHTVMLLG